MRGETRADLDDLEVEQRLPARAGEERERDKVAVQLGRGDEDVSGLVLYGQRRQRFQG